MFHLENLYTNVLSSTVRTSSCTFVLRLSAGEFRKLTEQLYFQTHCICSWSMTFWQPKCIKMHVYIKAANFWEGGFSHNQRCSISSHFNLRNFEVNHCLISRRKLMREYVGRADCHLRSSWAGWDIFAEDVSEGEEVNDEEQRLQDSDLTPVVTGTGFMSMSCAPVNLQSYIKFSAHQNPSE